MCNLDQPNILHGCTLNALNVHHVTPWSLRNVVLGCIFLFYFKPFSTHCIHTYISKNKNTFLLFMHIFSVFYFTLGNVDFCWFFSTCFSNILCFSFVAVSHTCFGNVQVCYPCKLSSFFNWIELKCVMIVHIMHLTNKAENLLLSSHTHIYY